MQPPRPAPDAIESYRRTATVVVMCAALVLVSPLALRNLFVGEYLLGAGALTIVTLIATVALAVRQGRDATPLLVGVMLAALTFISLSLQRQGIVGVLWSYPLIIGSYFLLDARWGQRFNVVVLLVVIPQVFLVFDPLMATRIAATLTAVSAFGVISIRVVADQQQKLKALAVTDPLTGLYNRMLLTDTLDGAIAVRQRQGTPATLLLIDIDHFKQINDTRGHDTGDAVLVDVARHLQARVRRVDRVFRIGGEEFLVLLAGTDLEPARLVAESMRAAFAGRDMLPGLAVTVSIGIAALGDGEVWSGWMKRADEALYRAKHEGRNRIVG